MSNGVARARILALDLNPQRLDIRRANWMSRRSVGLHLAPFERELGSHPLDRVVFGNPPYGSGGAIARQHLIRALDVAPIVAMLLPSCAGTAEWQQKMPSPARLVLDQTMGTVRFDRGGKRVNVAVHWQVWVRDAGVLPASRDLRARDPSTDISLADVGIEAMWGVKKIKGCKRRWDMAFVSHGFQSSRSMPVGRVFRKNDQLPAKPATIICVRAQKTVCQRIEALIPALIRKGSVSHCGVSKRRLLAALDQERPIAPPQSPEELLIEALHTYAEMPMHLHSHCRARLECEWRMLAHQQPAVARAAVEKVSHSRRGRIHEVLTSALLKALE
ncbi:hypothetical protein [Metallibacterium scheffleri]|uniref:hypothetical protein n=1 Tax=Metallibacterium scheffleri TaxID=993689 RepID=UPI0023EFCBE6|nr:hypothetical protein [Metallibacterium scheffleri]